MRWIGLQLQRIVDELFDYGDFFACCLEDVPPSGADDALPPGCESAC